MAAPPSEGTFPPLVAVTRVIFVAAAVVNVGIPARVVNVTSFP
jgi:hypothetical protein